jgi:hypothetical protein
VDGSRLTVAEHVALARSLGLHPLADRQSDDETLRTVRLMAPDSREQGRLVAMWLPRDAPSDFVVDLSGKPVPPPEDPKKPGGGYLSHILSLRTLLILLESPTILTFQVSTNFIPGVVLASYPDSPDTTINLGDVVKVSWDVASNPTAIEPLVVEFTWVSLTDGLHKYYGVPAHGEMHILPTDLATLWLFAWHNYAYQDTAALYINVNKPSVPPPPHNGPPPPCVWYYFILRPDPPDPELDPCVPWAVCASDDPAGLTAAQSAADNHLLGYSATQTDQNGFTFECQPF